MAARQAGSLVGSSGPFRRLTLKDGDWIAGERCELGHNEWRYGRGEMTPRGGRNGTFIVYRSGMRAATFVSLRLVPGFPIQTRRWQTLLQMKQANPGDARADVPIIAMDVGSSQGKPTFAVYSNERNPEFAGQTFPAKTGTWIRFVFDVYYSSDPENGWLQVSADLNGDGDLDDPGEVGEKIKAATLEVQDTSGVLAAGAPIPSHLRLGIYHDEAIQCESVCSIDIDNVQVIGPR